MARKKRYGLTSQPRFKLKAYRVVSAGVPQELALEYTNAVAQTYALGFGEFYKARRKVMDSEVWARVPSALRGLYLAFVNEVVSKVLTKGVASIDEIVGKWERMGLDPGLLWDIAEVLGFEKPEVEAPKPAPKA